MSKANDATIPQYGDATTQPLTMETLLAGYQAIKDREERIRETRIAWGEQIRAKSPEARARWEAEYQACCEMTGLEPDPINPPMVHPNTHKRIMARADEIMATVHRQGEP